MQNKQHLVPSDFGLNSFQELIYQPPQHVGDNLDDLDAFRDALLNDLTPIRPHEVVMAENIIMIEWEIVQIVIQKRQIARAELFDEIIRHYVKTAEDKFNKEEKLQQIKEQEELGGDYLPPSIGEQKVFNPYDAETKAKSVISHLKSGDKDRIEQAQIQMKEDLPSPETIPAAVYDTGSKYRELDDALSVLERRRRRLLEDYKNLQNAYAIDVMSVE